MLEHGEWLASHDRADEAPAMLAEARDIFTRLRAAPWLARLDAVGTPRAPSAASR